jgi:hypothetical protein
MRGLLKEPGSGEIWRRDRVMSEAIVHSMQAQEQYQLRSKSTPAVWSDTSARPFPHNFSQKLRGPVTAVLLTLPQAGLLHLVSFMRGLPIGNVVLEAENQFRLTLVDLQFL